MGKAHPLRVIGSNGPGSAGRAIGLRAPGAAARFLRSAAALLIILLPPAAEGQLAAQVRAPDLDSFEHVWKTIRDKHWDPKVGGLDWQAVHGEFRPKVGQAKSTEEARELMNQMLGRLGRSHFAVVPSVVYRDMGGGVDESADYPAGTGETGMDVRVIDGQVLVTKIAAATPAAAAGVRPGWQVLKVRGTALSPVIDRLRRTYRGSTLLQTHLRRAALARMSGDIGEKVTIEFLDHNDRPVSSDMVLMRPQGNRTQFGHLPSQFVWFESRRLEGDVAYVAFNLFLDPARIMKEFADAVQSCRACPGIIIDLRGNPGGIGGMSLGMAGWFIDRPDQRLGTMYTRDGPLKFVIMPRAQPYSGPVAILVDECSASTSEIFAGGLQDLGRARIFGARTAGAALPSVIEKLPNGDGFQYAIADYVSEGGKTLEGRGVIPDEETVLTRAPLLAGRDPAAEAAQAWIQKLRVREPELGGARVRANACGAASVHRADQCEESQ